MSTTIPDTNPAVQSDRTLLDALGRPLHDLRISVIDRCNFRCRYCMPEEEYTKNYTFLEQKDWLNYDEITKVVRSFVQLGVSKVRLTGGEPLLRPNLVELIEKLNQIDGIEDLAVTTNGLLLGTYAADLKKAGLHRLTVSLDTLDEKIFRFMTGNKGDLNTVLKSIQEAERAGFESIKINVVVQKGVNDHAVLDLVKYFKGSGHIIRFIEYMDVGNCNHWDLKGVVPSAEILKQIHQHFPLKPVGPQYHGEVASRYQYVDGEGEIGFISSVTQPFCRTCTRARLSTDGKIYTCLFSEKGIDIRTALKHGATEADLLYFIKQVWLQREDRYSEQRSELLAAHKILKKVEMFQIGG